MKPSPTIVDITGKTYVEHFLMHLFCAIPQKDPRQQPIFDKGGKVKVTIQLDGQEMPDPVAGLETYMKRMEEHFEGVAAKRALEMVNAAGLSKLSDTIQQAEWGIRDAFAKAGIELPRED